MAASWVASIKNVASVILIYIVISSFKIIILPTLHLTTLARET